MKSQPCLVLSVGLLSCLFLTGIAPAGRGQLAELIPASTVDQSVPLEQAVVAEINRARTNPQAYAEWLKAQRSNYNGTILSLPGEAQLQTREGVTALDDAIAFLQNTEPVAPLILSPGMSYAAHDQAIDLGNSSNLGAVGNGDSSTSQRLNRYGTWSGRASELNSYGRNTAAAIVMQLILNDGNVNRPFRAEIFNSDYQFTGVACELNATQRSLCIINYAVNYTENASATPSAEPPAIPAPPLIGAVDSLQAPQSPNASPEEASHVALVVAPAASYLSALELEIIAETNELRSNPAAYADKLAEMRQYYRGNTLQMPGQPAIETEEGIYALDEAIAVLRRTAPLPPLAPSRGLSSGARDHVRDMGASGTTGHFGSDGSTPFERITRYGTWAGVAGENISYSPINTAHWHIVQLVIDDGVPDRSHRSTLLNPEYRLTGVACGAHAAFGGMCDITYASRYTEASP